MLLVIVVASLYLCEPVWSTRYVTKGVLFTKQGRENLLPLESVFLKYTYNQTLLGFSQCVRSLTSGDRMFAWNEEKKECIHFESAVPEFDPVRYTPLLVAPGYSTYSIYDDPVNDDAFKGYLPKFACYYFESVTFDEALDRCRAKGGELYITETQARLTPIIVFGYYLSSYITEQDDLAWLGIRETVTGLDPRAWEPVADENVAELFYSWKPDLVEDPINKHCVASSMVNSSSAASMVDERCSATHPYICQLSSFPTSVAPSERAPLCQISFHLEGLRHTTRQCFAMQRRIGYESRTCVLHDILVLNTGGAVMKHIRKDVAVDIPMNGK